MSARHSEQASRRSRGTLGGVIGATATGIMTGLTLLFAGVILLTVVIPAVTGSTALTVKTSSMAPALPPGTMVIVRPTDFDAIAPGTVITYQVHSGESTLVTHRVTQRQELANGTEVLVTRGDANPLPDDVPIIEEQVRGTVWYAIPFLGWVTSFVTGETRSISIMIIVAGLLSYAAWMLVSHVRDRRRRAADRAL